jgi:hypothetical protein
VLDRNGNGKIDSAMEMFGNLTAQPLSKDRNGFLALAVFDLKANGGNGDQVIDKQDAVWPKLKVWIDANHDGVAQSQELHPLDQFVDSIALTFVEVPLTDANGNHFRYKGHLTPKQNDHVDKTIYDVFLVTQ